MSSPQASSCCESSCCGGTTAAIQADEIRQQVRGGYAAIALQAPHAREAAAPPVHAGCCGSADLVRDADSSARGAGGCCGGGTVSPADLAQALGYSVEDLRGLPEGANMGLSCGNPTALASLRPGDVVVDLGSGGGFDCFVAGPRVGAAGRVIGIDMTPPMISKARRGLVDYAKATGLSNVEFRLGEIENLPVADSTADVVISNCVLNLSPDKPRVWREIARILRPGGRIAVSDLALLRPLPPAIAGMVEALIGCISGAALMSDTLDQMRDAGLVEIDLVSKPQYIAAMTRSADPLFAAVAEALPPGTGLSDFITSLDISARKP